MKENQLTSSNLIRKFGTRTVVDNVSFFVNSGEVVGLLGPNGAGKTTSFYMTVGLLKPSSGEVTIDRNNITELPIHKRARMGIGYLPQNSSVFRKLSVEDNLRAIMEVWGIPRNKRSQLLEKLIDQFGIGHIRKSLGISLSGGERRRLEIARTLVISPRFLLLDEPFASLDAHTRYILQEWLANKIIETNKYAILVTHDVREALFLSEEIHVLKGLPSEINKTFYNENKNEKSNIKTEKEIISLIGIN